ncbi:beta-lactamase superfamily II metal-dependent hydrolase [Sinobacterium caligoides]|uniref:Beta-lactamase superfamily II metal-dependent hydrolase n=1 Tax=Sinobacterium caligoides TaxID=933926 RepID=A0A3N2E0W5_9GAMM|nr:MBL fold metallo-hydrolase [Sinobacterium caligoides]ROS05736.1 beta-lactamase superfamily II metal-dependent hydrolase [Sinobacterium caligoides]
MNILKQTLLWALLACTTISQTNAETQSPDKRIDPLITVFNVDQAAAMVIISPNLEAVLIDSGRRADQGVRIANYLKDKGINTLKAVITTHYDADHIKGLPSLIENGIAVERVYDQGPSGKRTLLSPTGKQTVYGKYVISTGDFNGNGVQDEGESNFIRQKAEYGDTIYLGAEDEVSIRVVSVRGDTRGKSNDLDLDPSKGNKYFDENPGSIGVTIRHKEFTMYSGGDQTGASWKDKPRAEELMLLSGAIIGGNDVDVLNVNHHGSDTSTSSDLANKLKPEVSIISTKFGHDRLPKKTTLKQLAEAGSVVLITGDGQDDNGEFAESKSTEDDGWDASKYPIHNDQGDIEISITSGEYKVTSTNGFNRTYSFSQCKTPPAYIALQ